MCDIAQETTFLLLSDPRPQMAPILAFLTSTCGLEMADALKVVAACPQIICLSVKNLGQKVNDDDECSTTKMMVPVRRMVPLSSACSGISCGARCKGAPRICSPTRNTFHAPC